MERRTQIADALLSVARDKAVQKQLVEFGLVPVALGPAEYQRFLQAETARWGAVIKAQNITVE